MLLKLTSHKNTIPIAVSIVLAICTLHARANVERPRPGLPYISNKTYTSLLHSTITDTVPATKPAESVKKEDLKKPEPAVDKGKQEVKDAAGNIPVQDIKTIKEVPKARKQPKPIVVQGGPNISVKVPRIKTPKVVIKKIKL